MNKDNFYIVANNLKLELNKKLEDELKTEYDEQIKRIEAMQKIDTLDIEPMVFIDESETTFMREDISGPVLDVKVIIDNSPTSQGDFISVKKVVK